MPTRGMNNGSHPRESLGYEVVRIGNPKYGFPGGVSKSEGVGN